jgi:sodium-dependent phosphate cotransporter
VLTNPFTKAVVQLDKKVLKGWATNDMKYLNSNTTIFKSCKENSTCYLFHHLGPKGADIGDSWAGAILLVISLTLLCGCLMGMVKLLNSLLGEQVRAAIKQVVNKDIPIRGLGWLTGYLAMLVGAVLTVLVQSSSVFTSTLTPLAGAGLVSLERC